MPLTQHISANRPALHLKDYEQVGGYQSVQRAFKTMSPQEITKLVQDSGLKGQRRCRFQYRNEMELCADE